jgi:hypothetical protein
MPKDTGASDRHLSVAADGDAQNEMFLAQVTRQLITNVNRNCRRVCRIT